MAISRHSRELQSLRAELSCCVDKACYNQLNEQLKEAEGRVQQLQAALNTRASETSKLLMGEADTLLT